MFNLGFIVRIPHIKYIARDGRVLQLFQLFPQIPFRGRGEAGGKATILFQNLTIPPASPCYAAGISRQPGRSRPEEGRLFMVRTIDGLLRPYLPAELQRLVEPAAGNLFPIFSSLIYGLPEKLVLST